MRRVAFEGDAVGHLDGRGPDPHRAGDLLERRHRLRVEVRDRHRLELDRHAGAARALEAQLVRQEVELRDERALAAAHRLRREPPRREVERRVPPVIHERRVRERELADDLHPHVQGGISVAPSGKG
jgi:hypothetical protein